MRPPWLSLVGLVALFGCGSEEAAPPPEPPPGPPVGFRVMTFNVLCSFCDPDYDPWDERLAHFDDLFARHEPDLIGLQELAFAAEIDQILALRPGFGAAYYQKAESGIPYPDATVLYRLDRFEVVARGDYWLSPTPDVPSSTGFAEQQLPRLVYWVELRDLASRRPLYFATTHFDNNAPSQELSAPLVVDRTAPFADRMPAVVVGDFNSQPDDLAYQILLDGGFVNAEDLAVESIVDHDQATPPDYDYDARIDHILLAGDPWSVPTWSVDLHQYGPNDLYPSDHRAMVADLLESP